MRAAAVLGARDGADRAAALTAELLRREHERLADALSLEARCDRKERDVEHRVGAVDRMGEVDCDEPRDVIAHQREKDFPSAVRAISIQATGQIVSRGGVPHVIEQSCDHCCITGVRGTDGERGSHGAVAESSL